MDTLESMMSAETEEEVVIDEESGETRGRPRELKSYILDANQKLTSRFETPEISGVVQDTGIDTIKILYLMSGKSSSASFFVDIKDDRFWTLHTNSLAENTSKLIPKLARSPEHQIDRAWIPTQILQKIPTLNGNTFDGIGLRYEDFFNPRDEESLPIEELSLTAYGSSSRKALEAVMEKNELQQSISYSKIRVLRGAKNSFTKDIINYDGSFSVKKGASSDDHVFLVDQTTDNYKEVITRTEKLRLGTHELEGYKTIEGKAFNFEFKRRIENIEFFLSRLLSTSEPFRLWGIRTKLAKDYYQVLAVDMHTGYPLDFEVTSDFMRVYLPDGACGNTILRLYTNLQHSYDSRTRCVEIFA